MSIQVCEIRKITEDDVDAILAVISSARREYGLEGRVSSILEPSDLALYETYRQQRSAYFVALSEGTVVGGAGISPLRGVGEETCELQRMYLQRECRGRGVGKALLSECLHAAVTFEFKYCYAETIQQMTSAIKFYKAHGFRPLSKPIGNTGHNHNDCWLLRSL